MAKTYSSDTIDVTFVAPRCLHAEECIRGLPVVFDKQQRPWIQPWQAPADAIAAVIARCPSGALHFTRKDGGAEEAIPDTNQLTVSANGPLYGRANATVKGQPETRFALCRCGASANKPFCDNSHRATNFVADGRVHAHPIDNFRAEGQLTITPLPNGPLLLQGNFELCGSDDQTIFQGVKAALCRCGHSANKPFCDGTHAKIGFQAE
jgi:CDGSH-type Zn-finger protein/uncharacterized Fe-S cluster protein YjdI